MLYLSTEVVPCYLFVFRVICGITDETTKGHIVRAALEAVCFQIRDILEAMSKDCGLQLTKLQVDGGMTANNLLKQTQADLVGISVSEYHSYKVLVLFMQLFIKIVCNLF